MALNSVSAAILRSVVAFAIFASLFALAGCGNSSPSCTGDCCGPVNVACPATPAHIYATGIDGKVTIFTAPAGQPLGAPTSVSPLSPMDWPSTVGLKSCMWPTQERLTQCKPTRPAL